MNWKVATILPIDCSSNMSSLGYAGVISGNYKDYVIVAGGSNFPDIMPWDGGKKKLYDKVYVYLRKDKKLNLIQCKELLPEPVSYAASASFSNGIIYAGGETINGLSDKVYLMYFTQNILHKETLPSLPKPIANASIVIDNEKVYLLGGESLNGVTNQFIFLDLKNLNKGWVPLPSFPVFISHTVLLVQGSSDEKKIFVFGGRNRKNNGISDLYNTIYEYNFKKSKWVLKSKLPFRLSAGTGVSINDHQILLLGGDKGNTFHKVETLIAQINSVNDVLKKEKLLLEKKQVQLHHPGFSNEILLYDSKVNSCKRVGKSTLNFPVTTNAFMVDNQIFITSGEIRPGVRTPNILTFNFKP